MTQKTTAPNSEGLAGLRGTDDAAEAQFDRRMVKRRVRLCERTKAQPAPPRFSADITRIAPRQPRPVYSSSMTSPLSVGDLLSCDFALPSPFLHLPPPHSNLQSTARHGSSSFGAPKAIKHGLRPAQHPARGTSPPLLWELWATPRASAYQAQTSHLSRAPHPHPSARTNSTTLPLLIRPLLLHPDRFALRTPGTQPSNLQTVIAEAILRLRKSLPLAAVV